MCGHRNERDPGPVSRRAMRAELPVDRRGDGRRDHRRGPQLRRRVHRRHGPGHRQRRRAGARRASSSWRRRAAAPTPSTPIRPALEGAYELGRGEARSGRSMDALLAAYRVGARVSWRHMSASAVARRADRRAARPLRRAGVRLHRPAVGVQRRRAQRRAGDHRPGPRALPGAAGRPAARPARPLPELDRGRRAGRLGAAAHPDGGDPPGGRRCAGRWSRSTAAHAALRPRTCPAWTRRPTSWCCSCRTPRAGPGRRCCARSTGGTPSSARPARGREVAGLLRRGPAGALQLGLTADGHGAAGHRGAAGRPGAPRRRRGAGRPARAGARPAGRPQRRRPREAGRDAARRGCCTTDAGSRSPPSCSCTRRRSATAWGSCASSTATGSRTRHGARADHRAGVAMSGDDDGRFTWSTAAALVAEVRRAVGADETVPEFGVEGGTGLDSPLAVPGLAVGAVAAQLLAARELTGDTSRTVDGRRPARGSRLPQRAAGAPRRAAGGDGLRAPLAVLAHGRRVAAAARQLSAPPGRGPRSAGGRRRGGGGALAGRGPGVGGGGGRGRGGRGAHGRAVARAPAGSRRSPTCP